MGNLRERFILPILIFYCCIRNICKKLPNLLLFSFQILEIIMAKICEVTKRKPSSGYKYAIRGIAKKKKGIGLKVTGKTKRRFEPNLKKKRLWLGAENRFVTLRLSTAALRTIDKLGLEAVVKQMRSEGSCV
jgi:large subunit ribosomal protein L28